MPGKIYRHSGQPPGNFKLRYHRPLGTAIFGHSNFSSDGQQLTLAGGIPRNYTQNRHWVGDGVDNIAYVRTPKPLVLANGGNPEQPAISFVVVFRKVGTGTISGSTLCGLGASGGGGSGTSLCRVYGGTTAGALALQIVDSGGGPGYGADLSNPVSINDQAWHCAVVTADLFGGGSNHAALYIDGVPPTSTLANTTNFTAAMTFDYVAVCGTVRQNAPLAYGPFEVALFVPIFGKLTQREGMSLSRFPWQLLSPISFYSGGPPRVLNIHEYAGTAGLRFGGDALCEEVDAGGGSVIHEYVGSGGVEFGGAAVALDADSYRASDGIEFGGAATVSISYAYCASGGVVFDGAAIALDSDSYRGNDGIEFSGDAQVSNTRVYRASGGVTFGGVTPALDADSYLAVGGVLFGGTAEILRAFAYFATGGVEFGGQAVALDADSYLADGGVEFGGAAIIASQDNPDYVASGGLKFGGAAHALDADSYRASGGVRFGGTARALDADSYQASGGVEFGGAADADYVQGGYVASGGVEFGGTAIALDADSYRGAGGVEFGGAAQASEHTNVYIASGGVQFGGAANSELVRRARPNQNGHGAGNTRHTRGAFPTINRYRSRKPKTPARVYVYAGSGGIGFSGSAEVATRVSGRYIPVRTSRKYYGYNAACEFEQGRETETFLLLAA